jgi:hypothetical protein
MKLLVGRLVRFMKMICFKVVIKLDSNDFFNDFGDNFEIRYRSEISKDFMI